jgi:hypothetical protein
LIIANILFLVYIIKSDKLELVQEGDIMAGKRNVGLQQRITEKLTQLANENYGTNNQENLWGFTGVEEKPTQVKRKVQDYQKPKAQVRTQQKKTTKIAETAPVQQVKPVVQPTIDITPSIDNVFADEIEAGIEII